MSSSLDSRWATPEDRTRAQRGIPSTRYTQLLNRKKDLHDRNVVESADDEPWTISSTIPNEIEARDTATASWRQSQATTAPKEWKSDGFNNTGNPQSDSMTTISWQQQQTQDVKPSPPPAKNHTENRNDKLSTSQQKVTETSSSLDSRWAVPYDRYKAERGMAATRYTGKMKTDVHLHADPKDNAIKIKWGEFSGQKSTVAEVPWWEERPKAGPESQATATESQRWPENKSETAGWQQQNVNVQQESSGWQQNADVWSDKQPESFGWQENASVQYENQPAASRWQQNSNTWSENKPASSGWQRNADIQYENKPGPWDSRANGDRWSEKKPEVPRWQQEGKKNGSSVSYVESQQHGPEYSSSSRPLPYNNTNRVLSGGPVRQVDKRTG